jgi:hypothetical protein
MNTIDKSTAVSTARNTLFNSGIETKSGSYATYVDNKLTDLPHIYFEPTSLNDLVAAEEAARKNGLIAKVTKYVKEDQSAAIVIEIL